MCKRFVSVVICCFLLIGMLPGCSTGSKSDNKGNTVQATSQPKNEQPAKKDPVTLNFWFPGEDQSTNDYFNAIGKEFEKSNTNIKIQTTQLPTNASDIDTKLNAAKLSGTYPDVFSAYLYFIPTRGPRGEFAVLDEYINKWAEKNDIFESAIDIGKYKGQVLGLGFYPAPILLAYRKDFFKEAGLDPEKPPKNWDEISEYAIKLTVRDGSNTVTRAGLDIPFITGSVFMDPILRQFGAVMVDEVNQVPHLDDPEAIEGLKYIVDLKNKNVAIPFNFDKKQEHPFVNGKAAMGFLLSGQITGMINNDPSLKEKIGIAPVPERKKKVNFAGYRLFTLGSESKYKDEGWKFIEFLMTKEQVTKRAKDVKIPVVRKSLTEEFIKLDPKMNPMLIEYVKYGKGSIITPWASLYTKYENLAYEEAISGKKSAEKALKDAQAALKDEISKLNLSK